MLKVWRESSIRFTWGTRVSGHDTNRHWRRENAVHHGMPNDAIVSLRSGSHPQGTETCTFTYLVVFFQVLVKGRDRGEEDDGTGIIEEWDPGVSLAPRTPRERERSESDESAQEFSSDRRVDTSYFSASGGVWTFWTWPGTGWLHHSLRPDLGIRPPRGDDIRVVPGFGTAELGRKCKVKSVKSPGGGEALPMNKKGEKLGKKKLTQHRKGAK